MHDRDFADLAELSYKKKLEAAEEIGTGRIQVIDPAFGHSEKVQKGVDMKGFEVPLYRSPPHGEVDSSSVGLDAARVHSLLKDADNPPKSSGNPQPGDASAPKTDANAPAAKPGDANAPESKPSDTKPEESKPPQDSKPPEPARQPPQETPPQPPKEQQPS
jgi:hypothetical protein